MKDFDRQWERLVALARQAPDDGDASVPMGFAARVAARAGGSPAVAPWTVLLEQFAVRGLLAAAACGVAAFAFNYFGNGTEPIEDTGLDEGVASLLDLSS
jgi:hypothetical protein